jgi:sensor histidine kinase YesM
MMRLCKPYVTLYGMLKYRFIFSDEKKYRLQRHIIFWIIWWIFNAFLYSFSPATELTPHYTTRLLLSSIDAFFYLFAHIFLAYSLMYYVVPRFILKEKYLKAVVVTIILLLATATISAIINFGILNPLWKSILANVGTRIPHSKETGFFNALLAGLRGAITVGGFAAAIKLIKYLYLKEQRNTELQKQNISSQLELLKAQVHPHFLFNTLNNIYSHAQVASPDAPRLVAGLSDLLRYMLYECNQATVPLQKELKMLRDYIVLEQIRYNNQLDLSIEIPDADGDLLIAPLLLLPLVENSFKHGTSQVLEHPWISLIVSLNGNQFKMKLVNGKSGYPNKTSSGIGIHNVRTRLELLYPGRHELRISNTDDAFIVTLNIELEKEHNKNRLEKAFVSYA